MPDQRPAPVCPYLGLPADRLSHFDEPSAAHRCFSLKQPGAVPEEYQQAWCLAANHAACARFVPVVAKPPAPARVSRIPSIGALGVRGIGLWSLAFFIAIVALYSVFPRLLPRDEVRAAPVGLRVLTLTPTAPPTEPPTPTPTATGTPVPTVVAPAQTGSDPLVVPTLPAGGTLLTLNPNPAGTGWVASGEPAPHWNDGNLHAGSFQGQTYASILDFSLGNLPPGSQLLFATIELTGRDGAYLAKSGAWRLEMLAGNDALASTRPSSQDWAHAAPLAAIGDPVQASQLAVGASNRFVFGSAELALLQKQLPLGHATFRLSAQDVGGDDLFTWQAGSGGGRTGGPVLYLAASAAPYTIITNTPTPANVLTAAAVAVRSTEFARLYGTPTPFPPGVVTATPNVGITYVPPAAAPANAATAQALSAYATAVAITTGTFTPTPANVVIVYPTATPAFIGADQLLPAPSPTLGVTINYFATPIPGYLQGKILINSNRYGGGAAQLPIVLNPTGSVLGALTSGDYYQAAYARESFSPDRQRRAIVMEDTNDVLQIWIQDEATGHVSPVTHLSRGVAYDPAWSPNGSYLAYVSTETNNEDEIYIYDVGANTSHRLTDSSGLGQPWNKRPSWSPDSQRLVFWSSRSGHPQIWVINADGTGLTNLSQNQYNESNPVWVKP